MSDLKSLSAFKFWCYKILPLVYDDSLSYYEVLCKVVDYINNLIEQDKSFASIIEAQGQSIEELKDEVKTVQEELEKFKNGDYLESTLITALSKWIDENIQELIGRVVKYVYFGLTNTGYFCAYIPETWDFITFDTIMDNKSGLFGHLVLRW